MSVLGILLRFVQDTFPSLTELILHLDVYSHLRNRTEVATEALDKLREMRIPSKYMIFSAYRSMRHIDFIEAERIMAMNERDVRGVSWGEAVMKMVEGRLVEEGYPDNWAGVARWLV